MRQRHIHFKHYRETECRTESLNRQMSEQFQVHIENADFAQAQPDGKVTAVGLGWEFINANPAPFAVVVFIDAPWDQTNRTHAWSLTLETTDGHPVVPAPGADPVVIDGTFEIGRPPGVTPGQSFHLQLAINIASGIPLAVGRYVWRFRVDAETNESWTRVFTVRPSPQAVAA